MQNIPVDPAVEFALLWSRYDGALRKYLLKRRHLHQETLDEVVSSVALWAWQHFDPAKQATFYTWICGIARKLLPAVQRQEYSAGLSWLTSYDRVSIVSTERFADKGDEEEGMVKVPKALRARVRLPDPEDTRLDDILAYMERSVPDLALVLRAMIDCYRDQEQPTVRRVAERTGLTRMTASRRMNAAQDLVHFLLSRRTKAGAA